MKTPATIPAKPLDIGLHAFKAELEAAGFRTHPNTLRNEHNLCDWYACRPTTIPTRECECNEGKARQLVVYPHQYKFDADRFASVEVDITGEAGGQWYTFRGYSIQTHEFLERLPVIEAALVRAWNAITEWKP